jgi:hypothetical protein
MLKTFRRHPISTILTGLTTITLPVLVNWWRNKDKEWFKDLPPFQKYGYASIDTGVDEQGIPNPSLKLAMSQSFGPLFSSIPIAIAEMLYNKDPHAMADMMDNLVGQYAPVNLPSKPKNLSDMAVGLLGATAGLGPVIEVIGNRAWNGSPIISRRMEGIDPSEQASEYSTNLSRLLSNGLGLLGDEAKMAPSEIDYLIQRWTGGFLSDVVKTSEAALASAGMVPGRSKKDALLELGDHWLYGRFFTKQLASAAGERMWDMWYGLNVKSRTFEKLTKDRDPDAADYKLTPQERRQLGLLNSATQRFMDEMRKLDRPETSTAAQARLIRYRAIVAVREAMRKVEAVK